MKTFELRRLQQELTAWAGARYTKSIASLELRHKEHNNDPYSLHNNTVERGNSAYIDLVYQASPTAWPQLASLKRSPSRTPKRTRTSQLNLITGHLIFQAGEQREKLLDEKF